MLSLLLVLACAKHPVAASPPSTLADGAEVIVDRGPQAAAVADYYDPVPPGLRDCTLSVDAQLIYMAQLACPHDRLLTDMRGAGVPGPEGATQAVMHTLTALGMSSAPRQTPVPVPGSEATAQVIDAQGPGLALTTWVVHNMGTMPQVVTCMTVADDTEGQDWCLSVMAAMLLPPAPSMGGPILIGR